MLKLGKMYRKIFSNTNLYSSITNIYFFHFSLIFFSLPNSQQAIQELQEAGGARGTRGGSRNRRSQGRSTIWMRGRISGKARGTQFRRWRRRQRFVLIYSTPPTTLLLLLLLLLPLLLLLLLLLLPMLLLGFLFR